MHRRLDGLELRGRRDGRSRVGLVVLRVVCDWLRVLLVVHGPDGDGRRLVVRVLVLVLVGDGRRARNLVVSENWRRGRGVCGVRCSWLEVAGSVVGCRRLRRPAGRWSSHMIPAKSVVGGSGDVRNATLTRRRVWRRPGDRPLLDRRSWRRGRRGLRRRGLLERAVRYRGLAMTMAPCASHLWAAGWLMTCGVSTGRVEGREWGDAMVEAPAGKV